MLNQCKNNSIIRITASATAVSVAMLACALSAPREAAAQSQPTTEGGYIAFETSDRNTVGADVLGAQSIPDGTRLSVIVRDQSYEVDVTMPAAEPRVYKRIEIFSAGTMIAAGERLTDGTVILTDASGGIYTGTGVLTVGSKIYSTFDPNAIFILEDRFQQGLTDLGYLAPDDGSTASIWIGVAAVALCCLKIKAKYTEADGFEGEVGFDCTCL